MMDTKYSKRALRIARAMRDGASWRLLTHLGRARLFGAPSAALQAAQIPVPDAERAPRTIPTPAATVGVIPTTIFQTWKVRAPLPANYDYWSRTLRALNPSYSYVLWDDVDNREFIRTDFPWFVPFYDRYPREIFRADIVRLFFLYRFGGLYADLDTECLRPLDASLRDGDVVLGRMGLDANFPHSIPNAMMASAPGQLFWLLAIAMAIERLNEHPSAESLLNLGPERLTGPILVKDAHDFYQSSTESAIRERSAPVIAQLPPGAAAHAGRVHVLAPEKWYPLDWNNIVHDLFRRDMLARRYIPEPETARKLFPEAHLVTYWTHSW